MIDGMPTKTVTAFSSLLAKLHKERRFHIEAIEEIDAIFHKFGMDPPGRSARAARPAAAGKAKPRARGGRSGRRIQGVKKALQDSLSGTPQSPAELAAKVSKKVGAKVNITTQLHMLKSEKKAKAVGRGQWVKA